MGSGYLSVTDPRAADHILSKTEVRLYLTNSFQFNQLIVGNLPYQSPFQKSYGELGALVSLEPRTSTNMTAGFRLGVV